MFYDNDMGEPAAVPSQNFTRSEEFWDFFPRETGGAARYSEYMQIPPQTPSSMSSTSQRQARPRISTRQATSMPSPESSRGHVRNQRHSFSGQSLLPEAGQASIIGPYDAPFTTSISTPLAASHGESPGPSTSVQQAEGGVSPFLGRNLYFPGSQPTADQYRVAAASTQNYANWYNNNTWSPSVNPGTDFAWTDWSAIPDNLVSQVCWPHHQTTSTQPPPHPPRVAGNDIPIRHQKTEPREPYVPSVILHSPLETTGNSYNLLTPSTHIRPPNFGHFRPHRLQQMANSLSDPSGLPSPHSDGSERMADHSADEGMQRENRKGGLEPPRDTNGKIFCPNPDCNAKTFDRKCEWSKHMDKHERPYVCQEPGCEKLRGFTYSGGLLRHQREVHKQHGGPKETFMCPYPNCKRHQGEGFTRRENLSEHMRRVHVEPEDSTQIAAISTPVAVPKSRKRKQPPTNADETEEVSELREEVKKLRAENEDKAQRISALEAQVQRILMTGNTQPQ